MTATDCEQLSGHYQRQMLGWPEVTVGHVITGNAMQCCETVNLTLRLKSITRMTLTLSASAQKLDIMSFMCSAFDE